MNERKTKINIINDLIKKNNLNDLKKIIQEKDVKSFNSKYKYEILIEAIKNNVSFSIIRYIIDQWFENINQYVIYYSDGKDFKNFEHDYDSLNETIEIESPLSVAIQTNNFKVADYLISHGSNINDISDTDLSSIITKKNYKYILTKNVKISNYLICNLLNSVKWYFIKDMFKYNIYNNSFIINLILTYKNNIEISSQNLEKLLKNEENKIIIKDEMYKEAFDLYFCTKDFLLEHKDENDYYMIYNYGMIKFLYENDKRNPDLKLLRIYKLLRNYSDNEKIHMINLLKENEPNPILDRSFINILEASIKNQKHEEAMEKFIEENNILKLKDYINNNNIKFTNLEGEFNNKGIYYYDLIHRALWNENGPMIKFLIDCGADINMSDEEDISPLHHQLQVSRLHNDNKGIDLVKQLIEWGADINRVIDGETPLIKAIQLNNIDLIQFMIEHKADINEIITTNKGNTALGEAIYNNNLPIVKFLVEQGADVNLGFFNGENPLSIAINKNNKEMVKYLIDCGVHINDQGNIYKHWDSGLLGHAATNNNLDMVKFLIENGAEVNVDAIIGAIESNNKEMVQYLVEHGADINQESSYYGETSVTPLLVSIKENNLVMVEYLIGKGAKVDMDDRNENSHLNAAVMTGNVKIVKYLIDWAIKQTNTNFVFIGKAYNMNEKYNDVNEDRELCYIPIKNLLDSYVKHFDFKIK